MANWLSENCDSNNKSVVWRTFLSFSSQSDMKLHFFVQRIWNFSTSEKAKKKHNFRNIPWSYKVIYRNKQFGRCNGFKDGVLIYRHILRAAEVMTWMKCQHMNF